MPRDIMAVGDLEVCDTHQDSLVALFCQTCEELICTRCVCQGPHSAAPHRDHVYLDIMEAFDIHKEDIEKLQGQVKDIVTRTKTDRQNAQNRLNKMKLELLRRRSLVERRKRALVDRIDKDESAFVQALEGTVRPSVDIEDQSVRDLDYQAVSREGFLGHLDSLRRMSSKESRAFLKNYVRLKRQLDDLIQESETEVHTQEDVEEQQRLIRSVNLNLYPEMRAIGRAFDIPKQVPGKPRLLVSWCVVGPKSVSLVWKHTDTIKVNKVKIYFKPTSNNSSDDSKADHNVVGVRYNTGRCSAVLRDLKPDTAYDVMIKGVNECGEGEAASVILRTLSEPEEKWRIWSVNNNKIDTNGIFNWKRVKKVLYSLLLLAVFITMGIVLTLMAVEMVICERLVGNIKSHLAVDVCSIEQRQFLHSQLNACDAPSEDETYYVPPSGLWVKLAQLWEGVAGTAEY